MSEQTMGDPERHWNYRVVRAEGDEFHIAEVHYEHGRPVGWTQEAMPAVGESLEELRADLQHMLEALDKPVLEIEDLTPPKVTE